MLVTTQTQSSNVATLNQTAQYAVQANEMCIIGDGAVNLAAGCLLSGERQNLRVFRHKDKSASLKQLPLEFEIRNRGANVSHSRSKTAFSVVSDDCKIALSNSEAIVVAASATEYGVLAKQLAPSLKNGQTIYLVNAPVAGGLEFANRIRLINDELQINIIELGGLFDYAKIEGGVLLVTGQRDKVSLCGNSRNETRRGLEIASTLSRDLVPCSNVLERGFSEVERLIRPALLLFAVLSARGKELDCISNIINPTLTSVVVAMENELQALARVFKCIVHNFFDTLNDFSGAGWEDADCLDQALISVARSLLGHHANTESVPVDVAIGILKRDVCETLVIISELARLSRTPVPVINSVISLASVATRCDLHKQGRTLSDLGLLGFDAAEIVELINA